MGAFKEFPKNNRAYSQMLWLFYVAEKLRLPFRKKGFAEFLGASVAAAPGYPESLASHGTGVAPRKLSREDRS